MPTSSEIKQEGSLCAQHALNALLQGEYYTADVLATIARDLDREEVQRIDEIFGRDSDEYRQATAESQHFDDTGFFSVEVIASALKNFGLQLTFWTSNSDPIAQRARNEPTGEKAYICHYRSHWLTVRKFGPQWINLNSMLQRAEPISDTYLSLFLAQLIKEGFLIFIVTGDLPISDADRYFTENPDEVKLVCEGILAASRSASGNKGAAKGDDDDDDDDNDNQALQKALRESRHLTDNDDEALQSALRTSREEYGGVVEDLTPADDDEEELQRAIRLSLANADKPSTSASAALRPSTSAASASASTSVANANAAEKETAGATMENTNENVRMKRLQYLERQGQDAPMDKISKN